MNISQGTYELLKDDADLVFKYRGKIETIGKGEMECGLLEEAKGHSYRSRASCSDGEKKGEMDMWCVEMK